MTTPTPDPELVIHTARQARRFAPVLFVAQLGIVAALWTGVDTEPLVVWLIASAVNAVRMWAVNHREMRRFETGVGDPHYVVRNIVHGVAGAAVWGSLPVVTQRYGDDTSSMIAFMAVLAMLCGAIFGTAASRLNFVAAVVGFVSPTVIATAVAVIDPSWFSLLFVAFGAMLTVIYRTVNQLVLAQVAATAENRQLAEQLAEALDTIDRPTSVRNRVGLERWLVERADSALVLRVYEVERIDAIRWLYGHERVDELLAAHVGQVQRELDDGASVIARLSDRQFVVVTIHRESTSEVPSPVALATSPATGNDARDVIALRLVETIERSGSAAATELARTMQTSDAKATAADLSVPASEVQLALLDEIPGAITSGSIEPWFQPILDVGSGAITGWEALLRWDHPRHGIVPPAVLLPVLAASGAMREVTRSVLDRSIEFSSRVAAAERSECDKVHVNVHTDDLRDGFETFVADALARHGVAGDRLVLEITERDMIDIDHRVVELLDGLRAKGVSIAVDDFGTGYSSLSHLFDLPLDCVKIDRRFVGGSDATHSGSLVVRAVVGLAHGLGLSVVAEGVESERHLGLLREIGCDEFQGFLVAPAVPLADALTFASSLPSLDRHPAG